MLFVGDRPPRLDDLLVNKHSSWPLASKEQISGYYALNIGSQSPLDNIFSNCRKEYPRDFVFVFGLSSLSNRS